MRGTGPCSLRPTCAKWSASNEADTARSYRPLQPAPPAHAYSSTMSVGVRPCTSMSAANAWAIRARELWVLGPKWRAVVHVVASCRRATNAWLLGTWFRRANRAYSALSSSYPITGGSGRGWRRGGGEAGAAVAASGMAGVGGMTRTGKLGLVEWATAGARHKCRQAHVQVQAQAGGKPAQVQVQVRAGGPNSTGSNTGASRRTKSTAQLQAQAGAQQQQLNCRRNQGNK